MKELHEEINECYYELFELLILERIGVSEHTCHYPIRQSKIGKHIYESEYEKINYSINHYEFYFWDEDGFRKHISEFLSNEKDDYVFTDKNIFRIGYKNVNGLKKCDFAFGKHKKPFSLSK